ncbi:uncharacterized protein LTR77_003410 [Saxophila tyrrhenica]|uniref:Uncharacterized protein n=1 Tax=Saxophila tyrrhenica TaxID=1690608 RepID=A0AAV9PHW2_9PEZI|nr:hypothetical protein LTR77_003410 [Saxophila tyrrhenica]
MQQQNLLLRAPVTIEEDLHQSQTAGEAMSASPDLAATMDLLHDMKHLAETTLDHTTKDTLKELANALDQLSETNAKLQNYIDQIARDRAWVSRKRNDINEDTINMTAGTAVIRNDDRQRKAKECIEDGRKMVETVNNQIEARMKQREEDIEELKKEQDLCREEFQALHLLLKKEKETLRGELKASEMLQGDMRKGKV